MPNLILVLSIFLLASLTSNAQCDKKISWHADHADLVDSTGKVLETKPGIVTIQTGTGRIIISPKESPDDGLEATVIEKTCNWKEAFRNGKTIYRAKTESDHGESNKATLVLEAKDGKITLLIAIDGMEGKKILLLLDSFEEIK